MPRMTRVSRKRRNGSRRDQRLARRLRPIRPTKASPQDIIDDLIIVNNQLQQLLSRAKRAINSFKRIDEYNFAPELQQALRQIQDGQGEWEEIVDNAQFEYTSA